MSAESPWILWWAALGLLTMQVALLAALAAVIARRVSAAAWRRTVWQGGILALLGLLALAFSGGGRWISSFTSREARVATQRPEAALAASAFTAPPGRVESSRTPGAPFRLANHSAAAPPATAPQTPAVSATSFPARSASALMFAGYVAVWFTGALTFLVLNALARLSFRRLRQRGREITGDSLSSRVSALAARLGLRRPVRLFESPLLSSPVATGVLWPALGLPPGFAASHAPEQQEVILAHEVAHLAARDPFWYLLADVLAALLWWHPLAWWVRRQLHAASETAADEASLLVHDGPRLLAECLVALGGRLARSQPAGAIRVEGAGFRSGLGRRVERLLDLPSRAWTPPGRLRAVLARTVAPAALVAAVILCTAWTVPQSSTPGNRMKTTAWKRSLPLYALLAALQAPERPATAAEAPANAEPPSPPPRAASPAGAPDGSARLRAKLDSIVLDEITYDTLPLSEVVKSLMKDAAAKDPEKAGVNFLFGQPTDPIMIGAPAIDPATGLPVAGAVMEIPDLKGVAIRIVPPLRKIRLTDALDAIKRVADQPITYTVEGYAVVFSLDAVRINSGWAGGPAAKSKELLDVQPPRVVPAQTRSFKVDTNKFFMSVKNMFRRQIDPASERVGEELRQEVFPRLGVKWDATENIVLYNHLTGVMLVRASQEDLETIQAAIETLGGNAADNSARGGSPALARKPDGSPATLPKP